MSSLRPVFALSLLVALIVPCAPAQNNPAFDLQGYEAFLAAHRDMSSAQLLALHSAGTFAQHSPVSPDGLTYFPGIQSRYSFTPYELSLLADHGFVVADRLRFPSFANALLDIYTHDLPVFVSSETRFAPLRTQGPVARTRRRVCSGHGDGADDT